MSKRHATGQKYKKQLNITTLLSNVADAYINAEYCMNEEVRNIMDGSFAWVKSYHVSPFDTTETNNHEMTQVQWTLYAKLREDHHQSKRIYSSANIHLLSVKASCLEGGGLGCFAEKTYHSGDLITLYMGDRINISPDAKHCDFPHVLSVTSKISVNPGASGKKLLLGGHKCNDTKMESGENVKKK